MPLVPMRILLDHAAEGREGLARQRLGCQVPHHAILQVMAPSSP